VTSDVVALRGLRGQGRHGWFDFEQEQGQEFVVDVELAFDTAAAARSDDLADTVDYGSVASAVLAVVEGEPVRLIETLAQRIADACLADPRVEQVTVTVHKPSAPLSVAFGDVTVTVVRSRG
jgi:7,8-dihydroneopterin aldolase/epimerase/oxygenase